MKSFSYVFVATIIARFSSLISFPITARVLDVSDMGELTIWHSVRGIILLGILAGMPDIVAREAGAHRSQNAFGAALRISYSLLAVLALVLEGVQLAAPGVLGLPHPHLLLVAVAVDLIPGLFMSSLAAMDRIRAYVVCIVVPAIVVACLSALLVLPPFSLGLVGPLYAHLTASSINALICLWLWRRHQEPSGAPAHSFATLLRQSVPVLGVSLVGMSIATVDRYSVRWFLGAAAVGFYAVSYQVAALLSFGGAAVRTSILSKLIAHAEQPAIVRRYFREYILCGSMFAVVLAALAPEIVGLLAGAKYQHEVELVPLLCAAILALELYSFGQSLAVARRRSQQAFYSIAAGAALSLLLVPALCYVFGARGVPFGLLAGYTVAASALLMRHAALDVLSWASLALVALVLVALVVIYGDPANIWATWALALRYACAALGAAVGLASLRALGREKTV